MKTLTSQLPEILKPFESQLESILVYAKGQKFDFDNLNKESLDQLMLGWLHMTKKLTEDITENIGRAIQTGFRQNKISKTRLKVSC